jgi:hypothetical protein
MDDRPWSSSVNATPSLVVPFCIALLSLLLLFLACGFGITGRALGPIIDERNRMSLTLAQLAMWSIILLSALLVFGLFNYGFGGLLITELQQKAAAATAANETPNTAKSALDAYNLFPSIPFYLGLVARPTRPRPMQPRRPQHRNISRTKPARTRQPCPTWCCRR